MKPAAFKSKRPAKPPRSTSQPNGEEINYLLHFKRIKHGYTSHFFISMVTVRDAFPENGGEWENVLKELINNYIQKGQTYLFEFKIMDKKRFP